ncbi:hypothetical protein HDK77DRAFT_239421 [Phyllosticta capitalensis]|uniref:uncharacterized protein n=1 Tax=Phyllosticta capitalensis TaxID=121624 RepID=UPI0031308B54
MERGCGWDEMAETDRQHFSTTNPVQPSIWKAVAAALPSSILAVSSANLLATRLPSRLLSFFLFIALLPTYLLLAFPPASCLVSTFLPQKDSYTHYGRKRSGKPTRERASEQTNEMEERHVIHREY